MKRYNLPQHGQVLPSYGVNCNTIFLSLICFYYDESLIYTIVKSSNYPINNKQKNKEHKSDR